MTANPPTRLATLRELSRNLLDTHDDAELRRQPHPELSPLLWHVGHVFFVENYWLAERVFGDTSITDPWRTLYFPELCAKGERSARLPSPATLRGWTRELDAIHDRYWARTADMTHPLLDQGYLHAFVRQHYAQHLETMRMASFQLRLADADDASCTVLAPQAPDFDYVGVPSSTVRLGSDDIAAYDNEQPPVRVSVPGFKIASAPVTNGQWLAFMQDDGYARAALWDADGMAWCKRYAVEAPQHWQRGTDNAWRAPDPGGAIGSTGADPVHGIGWYEARAFARWAGARLPSEAEWEAAVRGPGLGDVHQVWEWCDDAFAPYPGFKAFPYDGYSSPWFDGAHFVARGASRYTEHDIVRPGFRNFYPPGHRHVFAGLRLAA